jgi:predicted DNA-binding transcriptional regulator AlpA
VLLAAFRGLPTVDFMTSPRPEAVSPYGPGAVREGRPPDQLINIGDIRALFKLGRTAAYELTHRPDFPVPVAVSRRCLRWRPSEVGAYADALQRQGAKCRTRSAMARPAGEPAGSAARRITGTVRAARGRREGP